MGGPLSCSCAVGGGGRDGGTLPPGDDFVWASLCDVFLFFSVTASADASGAPYALVDARRMRITNVAPEARVLTLGGLPPRGVDEDLDAFIGDPMPFEDQAHNYPITVVLLLHDGRW